MMSEPRSLLIYLALNPPTAWGKNSKSSFKGRVVTNAAIQSTKGLMAGLLAQHRPEKPLEGPLKLHVMVCWPYNKTEKKAVVKEGRMVPKITKPDGDNVLATIKDVMETMQFFSNDSQIYCEHIERWYGKEGFIRIELREVDHGL